MVRNPASGPVVDPDLLWWRSGGPHSVQRVRAPPEVVRRRVKEDKHIRRYMAAMDVRFSNTWQVLWVDDRRYEDPVMAPSLWVSTARASGTTSGLDSSVVFDLY